MNPTSEQCNQWFDAWVENESESISARLYIAQRAAEWAATQSAERIAELERQRGKLLEAFGELLSDVQSLMAESEGVTGLHQNGDVATWDEIGEGGRFEWISHISEARAVIAEARGEK